MDGNKEHKKFVSKNTIFRLVKDVKDITSNPLTSDGIYYKHDSQDFLIGRAMIIGPKDTPYEGCPMFFRFNFPESYPHDPPKATFLTGDGTTRFHPNYYKCGKVCLSILNTWSGERWSGCQTITSILLIMISILTDNPYIHEPGMSATSDAALNYKKIVDYACKRKIINFLEDGFSEEFKPFFDDYKNYIRENKDRLLNIYEEKSKTNILETLYCNSYAFETRIDYVKLNQKVKKIFESIE